MTTSPADLLHSLIEATLKAGADAADARLSDNASLSVEVRKGELESVEREESRGLALRALVGRRQAAVSATDLSPDALKALTERVVAMAKLAPEDKYCGLAEASEIATDHPDLQLDCDDTPEADELERRSREMEAAAMAVPGVKQMSHAGASWSTGRSWLAASNGFTAHKTSGYSSMAAVAISERDGAMERDFESSTERRLSKHKSPEWVGREAGERAAARLGARKLDTQTAAVIFDNKLSSRLLGAFIGAISGPAIARGVSFLKDRMEKPVFAPGIDVIDDPLRLGGFGSRGFDGEGRPVKQTALVKDGVLTQWLLNGPAARQLGLKPNGFASMGFGDPPGVTTSNLDILPGKRSLAELMADAGKGLLVTDMFGPSLNPNTGDYSVGVSGFWFENGERAYPVSEVTVAGDIPAMLLRAVPGSDLVLRGSTNAPSLLIDGMALAAGDLEADLALLQDLALLKEVAREAGQLALDMMRTGAKAWDKSPGNPVTEADIAVNDLISKRLRGARPTYGWLSEETKDNPADRTQAQTWVVDPIDGTKAFVKGDTGFCVAIARLDEGQPVAGVVYNPNFDELLHARVQGGAFLNDRPIRATLRSEIGCRMVGQPDVFAREDAAIRWPGMELIRPMPNAVAWRLSLVAAGRWDAMVALNPKNDWDLAAAVLLVREAGGIVTDRNGDRLVFNQPSVVQLGVVAAGAVLHPLIMERLHNRPAA